MNYTMAAGKQVKRVTVAVLGGIDTLIFTAGIGEHAAPVRGRICVGLAFLGIHLDEGRNRTHDAVISREVVVIKAELEKFREQVQNVE